MKKVLFVDDDPVVVSIYRRKLEQAGYAVETAPDGLDAMKLANSLRPDVIILDIMMPKFSGLDVLRYLRAQPGLKEMRVVVLSNMFFGGEQREAAGAGADKVLPKVGCTPALLIDTIREVLGETGPENPPAPEAAG
jgi:CheY-like chemotaxis protein